MTTMMRIVLAVGIVAQIFINWQMHQNTMRAAEQTSHALSVAEQWQKASDHWESIAHRCLDLRSGD